MSAQLGGSVGSSVASSVKDGPRGQQTASGGTSVREYSYRAPSDVSGGSANSYGQNLSVAMLHDIVSITLANYNYKPVASQIISLAQIIISLSLLALAGI